MSGYKLITRYLDEVMNQVARCTTKLQPVLARSDHSLSNAITIRNPDVTVSRHPEGDVNSSEVRMRAANLNQYAVFPWCYSRRESFKETVKTN
jgi:hypothetical protein